MITTTPRKPDESKLKKYFYNTELCWKEQVKQTLLFIHFKKRSRVFTLSNFCIVGLILLNIFALRWMLQKNSNSIEVFTSTALERTTQTSSLPKASPPNYLMIVELPLMVKEWSTFQTRKHLICISLTLRVIVPAVLPPFVDTKNYHRDYSATYSFIRHIIYVSFTLNQSSIDESTFHLLFRLRKIQIRFASINIKMGQK